LISLTNNISSAAELGPPGSLSLPLFIDTDEGSILMLGDHICYEVTVVGCIGLEDGSRTLSSSRAVSKVVSSSEVVWRAVSRAVFSSRAVLKVVSSSEVVWRAVLIKLAIGFRGSLYDCTLHTHTLPSAENH